MSRDGIRLLPLAWLVILAGCGYALVGSGAGLPDDVVTVAVTPFENRTERAGLEQWLGEAVARELSGRGGASVVSDPERADAVLEGVVLSYTSWPAVLADDGRALEYQLVLTASVSLRRRDGTTLLQLDGFRFQERYEVTASSTGYSDLENLAVAELSSRFAESLISALLEGF